MSTLIPNTRRTSMKPPGGLVEAAHATLPRRPAPKDARPPPGSPGPVAGELMQLEEQGGCPLLQPFAAQSIERRLVLRAEAVCQGHQSRVARGKRGSGGRLSSGRPGQQLVTELPRPFRADLHQ